MPLEIHAAPFIFILCSSKDKSTHSGGKKLLQEEARGRSGGKGGLLTLGALNNERGRLLRMEAMLSASFEDTGEVFKAHVGESFQSPFTLRIWDSLRDHFSEYRFLLLTLPFKCQTFLLQAHSFG